MSFFVEEAGPSIEGQNFAEFARIFLYWTGFYESDDSDQEEDKDSDGSDDNSEDNSWYRYWDDRQVWSSYFMRGFFGAPILSPSLFHSGERVERT